MDTANKKSKSISVRVLYLNKYVDTLKKYISRQLKDIGTSVSILSQLTRFHTLNSIFRLGIA